ncbi:histidine kinase [Mesorhizobium sp. CN2-181]|uniref:histidine kinase n=1 Tax=Mesorhizobium yinganensis TaxID=3157707 RepID=UPI0032B87D09
MASDKSTDPSAPPVSAAQLRQKLLEKEMEKVSQYRKEQDAKQKELTKFTDEFLSHQVTEEEIATVRRLVMNAVEAGKLEAMVYSFPSELCTDSGRAINSNDPAWPQTLQGKAKEFFDRYQTFGKPQGYKLKAMIINFPGGMPGDVGFFLSWAPETK